jgi:hypothetical protein
VNRRRSRGRRRPEELDRLVVLGPIESRVRHPGALRHLGWCHACRERLADLLAFDGAVPASPVVRELLGRFRVRVRRGLACLAEIPSGFVLVAEPAPSMRAASVEEPRAEASSKARFDLPGGERSGEVFVSPDGEDAVRLTVQLSSSGGDDFTVYLPTAGGEDTNLLAAQTARPGTSVILRQVPAGAYVLEITENIRGGRTRLPLEVAVDGEEGVLR